MAQDVQGQLEQSGGLDTGVGDDQGLVDVGFFTFGLEWLQGPKSNLDLGQVDDVGHDGFWGWV
jgi:hypothetical protein